MRDPKFVQFFQEVCKENQSIQYMKLHFYHGEFSKHQDSQFNNFIREEVKQFADFVGKCLRKKSLKTLEVEVQIIQPPKESTTSDFSDPIIQKMVKVLKASEKPGELNEELNISLNELKLDLECSNSELVNLASVLIPKRSVKKLSLTKINSFVGGFQSLARLLTEGGLTELELSLNVNNYWKKKYSAANFHYGIAIGSPEMFQIPKERIYEEVFDATSSMNEKEKIVKCISKEDFVRKSENHLEEIMKALGLDERSCKLESRLVDDVSELYHVNIGGQVFPLPVCNGHNGKVSGFHYLFSALKDSKCRLESIYLNRCLIHRQAEYFSCLGEMFLENKTLREIKVENSFPPAEEGEPRVEYTVPLVLGLQHNTTLTSLDLGSLENITLNNTVFAVFSHCLSHNRTLRTLNLSRWKFELNLTADTERCARTFLANTRLTQLILAECEFTFTGLKTSNNIIADVPLFSMKLKKMVLNNSSINKLCLESLVISFSNLPTVLRSREVLNVLNFSSLQELDVSDKPVLDRNQDQRERTITDEIFINFFKDVQNNFATSLEVLKMANWKLSLQKIDDTAVQLKNLFSKLEKLKTISLNNVDLHSSTQESPQEPVLLKMMIKNLPQLRKLSILNCKLLKDQAPTVVKAIKQKVKSKKTEMTLYTKMMTPEGLDELLQNLQGSKSVDYKYDSKDGTLEIFQNLKKPLLVRMRSMKIPKK